MTEDIAKNIGSKAAIKGVTIGIVIAYLIMSSFGWATSFFKSFLWILEIHYVLHLLIGAIVMYLCGYFYGGLAGKEILIDKKNHERIGIKYALLTLLTSVFLSSWVGFFQEGIEAIGTNDNPFEDYIFKPVFWVAIFGAIPVIIVGIFFGKSIKNKGKLVTDAF